MDCVPACKTCTGLCKQAPLRSSADDTGPKAGSAKKKSGSAKSSGYIAMKCGHWTDWAQQRRMIQYRGKKKTRLWCEECQRWVDKEPDMPKAVRAELAHKNQEPLF